MEKKPNQSSNLLDLLSVQLEAALADLNAPQKEAVEFFNLVIQRVDAIRDEIIVGDEQSLDRSRDLLSHLKIIASRSIVEFQSFDRVEQRITNVKNSLSHLAESIHENPELSQMASNQELSNLVKSTYSLSHEHSLHELMEKGASIDELSGFCKSNYNPGEASDIELF